MREFDVGRCFWSPKMGNVGPCFARSNEDSVRLRVIIEEQAGADGMGQIFRATDFSTGEIVAAKILRDASR